MLSRVGSLKKNGRYRIVCTTAVTPLIKQTYNIEDFLSNRLVNECVGDVLDVFVFADCVKTVNTQRNLFSIWPHDKGHVIVEEK